MRNSIHKVVHFHFFDFLQDILQFKKYFLGLYYVHKHTKDVLAIESFQMKSIDWLFEFISFSGGELIGAKLKHCSDNIWT